MPKQSLENFVTEMSSVLEMIDTVLHSIDSDGLRLVDAIWDSFCVELSGAIEAVDTAMSRCLSDPSLAPFVNQQGVTAMLEQSKQLWLGPENWSHLLRSQRDGCMIVALEALARLPPELAEFQRCAAETLHGSSFPSNSWRTFEWPNSELSEASSAPLRAFLVALKQHTLPQLLNIVNEIGRELDADNLNSHVAQGYHKVKELHEMAAWYKGTNVASMEWGREQRRREQWQVLMDQRVAAVKKELERMCDEEALERSEFGRLWRPFLPRGGEFALAHVDTLRLVPHVQIQVVE